MASTSPTEAFNVLKNNVTSAISSYFPFKGRKQTVVLKNINVDDNLDIDDIRQQAEAKDLEKTWGVPIRGEVALLDNITGKEVDSRKMVLGRLPKLTRRFGFIVNGNEYQVDHLFRLKSGVYARIQENGDLESEFNLLKSPTGRNFSIKLDRLSKKFSLKQGETHIDLYPILHIMGESDEDLKRHWGEDIFRANLPKNSESFNKTLSKFFVNTAEDGHPHPKDVGEYGTYIHEFFGGTGLRPETTKITLGKEFTEVNGEALRRAANKILDVSRDVVPPDDRDSLAFKEIVSVEDFLPEKLTQRSAPKSIKSRLRQTVDVKQSVGDVVSGDLFNKFIHELFIKGGSLSERSEQTNPLTMLTGHRKTTILAKDLGGIKNENQITREMQVINPSHIGFLDPMHTPESARTGITLNLSQSARKNGKSLELPVYNVKNKKLEWVKVPEFHMSTTALPDQVRWENGKPTPISDVIKVKLPGGAVEKRPFSTVDYILPSAKGMFDYTSNLIPFLPSNQGNRVSMADKQMEQAISLVHREAPLVQSKTDSADPTHTYEKVVGAFTTTRSTIPGTVTEVASGHIKVSDGKKEHEFQIYDHFPLNDNKAMMHSIPLVKVGDKIKAGQIIADTNYTKNGALAIGTNLRVGYIPYKGYNYEDGIVISETASKKLTSDHLYKKTLEIDASSDIIDKQKYRAFQSTRAAQTPKEHWDALDENGIIKPGTKIVSGQVLVAALNKNTVTRADSALSKLGKRALSPYKDKSMRWDEDHAGTVVKVIKNPNGKSIKLYIKTEEPMVIGDKISGRHGNKGIVTQILPDHEMPHTISPDGEKEPLEVLLNPSGVPTRINVGQILETSAAKIAKKTGKPYIVNNFSGPDTDYRSQVMNDLKAHGISDEEMVYDPSDSRKPLGSVLVGPQYLLKLKHQVEKKLSVRGGGTSIEGRELPIDNDKQPRRGGEHGGQGFGALDIYALLGHNARHNLREMATYKSDHQDQRFWTRIQEGYEPPPPKAPFSYEKFISLIKGLGVNVTKEGTTVRLHPMLDKEILKQAGPRGEVKKGYLAIRSKDLKEEPGGLFDVQATGGKEGDKWSYMRMAEPMPNPIFVGENNRPGPIGVLLGLKIKDIDAIMKGEVKINGKTGGAALEAELKKINVDKEISDIRESISLTHGTELDRLNKKLKFLLSLKENNIKPHEAYILHTLPIIPPKFRPVSLTPKGDITTAPINNHYRNFAILNKDLAEFDASTFSEEHKHPIRAQLWEAFKALQSVGKYKPVYDTDKSGQRALKGILDTIGSGDEEQPKEGYFQSRLIKRRQNLSIRSTIVPEPALGLDEVGLPKNAAMELYKPFVVAQLYKWGTDPLAAQQEIKKSISSGSGIAFKALEKVVEDRPLLLKRDPVLHKFSIMAFKPKLIEGKAIQIHPLVTGGFNADFDGDTMAGTVPLSREAVEEAKKMFPSNNLFSPTSGRVMYTPSQEAMLGLHLLSKWGKKSPKKFSSVEELGKAVEKGDVSVDTVVNVKPMTQATTYGRILLESRMPRTFSTNKDILHSPDFLIKKKVMEDIATKVAKEHPEEFAKSINALKDLGNDYSYKLGFSFGLKDLEPIKERAGILAEAKKHENKARATIKGKEDLDKRLIEIYNDATEKIDKAAEENLTKSGNRLGVMVYSGARGKREQLRQMIAAPMLMQDATDKTIPTPVTRSYSEGLDVGDYWLVQHGARKGTLQRARGTADPGAISKDILNTTMSTLVTNTDCGTTQGILMDITHKDILDRHTAHAYKLKDGLILKAGSLVTPDILNRLKNNKIDKVLVRSPLKCANADGICAKCFGLNENGTHHDIGTNIGALSGQSMGEPAVQMAMDAFHTGGLATGRGAKSVDRLTRLEQLLTVPKKLRDEATIAMTSGKITEVKTDATGGVDLFINNIRHLVPKILINPNIKVGLEVQKGQKLSLGAINPNKLMEATNDIHVVQNYMASALHSPAVKKDEHGEDHEEGLYEKEGVRRRNIEVAVRALTNLTKVIDPGDGNYIHGDVVPRSVIEEHNRNLPKGHKEIKHQPFIKSIEQIPLTIGQDWMARLNYRELHRTMNEAISGGWKSDLHSTHPIPGLAYGAEFGKAPKGTKPGSY